VTYARSAPLGWSPAPTRPPASPATILNAPPVLQARAVEPAPWPLLTSTSATVSPAMLTPASFAQSLIGARPALTAISSLPPTLESTISVLSAVNPAPAAMLTEVAPHVPAHTSFLQPQPGYASSVRTLGALHAPTPETPAAPPVPPGGLLVADHVYNA